MRSLQPPFADKTEVGLIQNLIGGSFFTCQVHAHTLGAILGKLLPQERLEPLGGDNWPDQRIESPALTALFMLFGIGRGQPKAIGGRCHECGFSPRFGR